MIYTFKTIIAILGVLSAFYALPYANWEFGQKNNLSAIIIYIIALSGVFLSVFQIFS